MAWIWWLLTPLTVTAAAAMLTWWTSRPRRKPTCEQGVRTHRRYLADLADGITADRRAGR